MIVCYSTGGANKLSSTVYVLDDEAGIRLLLKEIIELEGFVVKEFDSPLELLENPMEDVPKLIFVDFNLPLMNGMEFVKRLNQQVTAKIPIVMISGYTEDELKDQINWDFIDRILVKPFNVVDVLEILKVYK
jgi:two-component system, response regulator, stage 0 sporulation protein F